MMGWPDAVRRTVSEVSAGVSNPDAADNGYWFHPNRVVLGSEDCAWEWPIEQCEGQPVGTLDMWSDDPAYPFRDVAIWELRGNRLWLCWGVRDSGERPTAFSSTADNGYQLVVLEPSAEAEPE